MLNPPPGRVRASPDLYRSLASAVHLTEEAPDLDRRLLLRNLFHARLRGLIFLALHEGVPYDHADDNVHQAEGTEENEKDEEDAEWAAEWEDDTLWDLINIPGSTYVYRAERALICIPGFIHNS